MKLFELIKRELLKGLEYTILIWCIILVICIVFNVNIENKAAFIILVPLLGKAAHYLNNMTVSENTDIMKREFLIIEYLSTLEYTISELQKLCTDEDLLERCTQERKEHLKESIESFLAEIK
jgi:hypothetical protein